MSHRYAEVEADQGHHGAYMDPKEIYAAYCRTRNNYAETLMRLLLMEAYDKALSLLQTELEDVLPGSEKFEQLSSIVIDEAAALKKKNALAQFIAFFAGMLGKKYMPAQTYSICVVVSALVARNRTFLNKSHAISHFKMIMRLFRLSASFPSYLNALHYLGTLEKIQISREELCFLKECAALKREPVQTSLLGGLAPVDEEDLLNSVEITDTDFSPDPLWLRLIETCRAGTPIPYDHSFLSFLLKNGFEVSLEHDGSITVGEYKSVGPASRLFDIARMYEKTKQAEMPQPREKKKEEPSQLKAPEAEKKEPKPEEKRAPEFRERHRQRRAAFKWYHTQVAREFVDDSYEKRRVFVEERSLQRRARVEARKLICQERAETVRTLIELVAKEIANKRESAKLEAAARRAEQLALREAEEKAKKWGASRSVKVPQPVQQQTQAPLRPAGDSWREMRGTRPAAQALYRPPVALSSQIESSSDVAATPQEEGKWRRNAKRDAGSGQ